MEYLIVLLVIMVPVASYLFYHKGKKRGATDFFKLIAAFGYDSKVKTFQSLNHQAQPQGHVFVGDSITQDFNVYEAFSGHHVYNRGIGGDTTEGVLKRLEVSIFELKPKTVFLLIGTNDLALLKTTNEDIASRIQSIVTKTHAFDPTIQTYVLSILPVNETMDPSTVLPRRNENIEIINERLHNIEHATYLDIASIFKDESGRLKNVYSMEGLHLSPLGYQALADALKPYIQ